MSTSNDVLDAARTCLLRSGGRKITLAEVAREAGVSRPTIYRRWPEVRSIIGDLLTKEMGTIMVAHRSRIDAALRSVDASGTSPCDARGVLDALVDTTVGVAVAVSENPVFASLRQAQPEVIAPYIVTRLGTSQRSVLAMLTELITQAQELGAIRPGCADHLSAMVLLIAQSAMQSRSMLEPILGAAWNGELRAALTGYLAPQPQSSPRDRRLPEDS